MLRLKFEQEFYKLHPNKDPKTRVTTERPVTIDDRRSDEGEVSQSSSSKKEVSERQMKDSESDDIEIKVSVAGLVVKEKSKIYDRDRKDAILTKWQVAVNNAAYELCQKDISLMYNRQPLKAKAEKKARVGYNFQKKTGSRAQEGLVPGSKAKRLKLSSDERKERIAEVTELIALKNSQIRKKQQLRRVLTIVRAGVAKIP